MARFYLTLVPLLLIYFLPAQTMNSFKWKPEGCYNRAAIGKSVNSNIVQKTVMVKDVSECQKECTDSPFDCVLLSFEISSTTNGTCLLSAEDHGSEMNSFLRSNPDADVYLRRRECRSNSNDVFPPPSTGLHRPTFYPSQTGGPFFAQGEVCFRRAFPNRRMLPRYVRASIPTRSLYECQTTCTRERAYSCQGFAFSDRIADGRFLNCEMTDVNIGKATGPNQNTMVDHPDRDFDLFVKDGFAGRDCFGGNGPSNSGSALGPGPGSMPGTSMRPSPGCFERTRVGIRLDRSVVQHSVFVSNVKECEEECARAKFFICREFSFRIHTSGGDRVNCELTSRDLQDLDPYRDLIDDKDSDLYERKGFGKDCEASSFPPPSHSINRPPNNNYLPDYDRPTSNYPLRPQYDQRPPFPSSSGNYLPPPDTFPPQFASSPGAGGQGCFTLAHPGKRFHRTIIRDSINTPNVADCEMECIRAQRMPCRGFSYRVGSNPGHYTSLESNCELSDMNPREMNYRDLIIDGAVDVYEKLSFVRGCDVPSNGNQFSPAFQPSNNVLPPYPRPDSGPIPVDCFRESRVGFRLTQAVARISMTVRSDLECKEECLKSRRFPCHSLAYKPDIGFGLNCQLTEKDERGLESVIDLIPDRYSSVFAVDPFIRGCEVFASSSGGPPGSGSSGPTNTGSGPGSGFEGGNFPIGITVGGHRCIIGSCVRDPVVGYWACNVDDKGNWDYCCNPDHKCGFSEGFPQPWCFVGDPALVQWRPCKKTSEEQHLQIMYGPPPIAYLHHAEAPPTTNPLAEPDRTYNYSSYNYATVPSFTIVELSNSTYNELDNNGISSGGSLPSTPHYYPSYNSNPSPSGTGLSDETSPAVSSETEVTTHPPINATIVERLFI